MRTPLRKPHNIISADISDYYIDSEYIIFLDGSVYKAKNGETGAIDSQSTAAHTVIQYALDNISAGKISVICDVVLTAGITGVSDIILDFNNHTITPATSFDMIEVKAGMILQNAIIDVPAITFNDVCITINGDATSFHGPSAKSVMTRIRDIEGTSASAKGTFLLVDCTDDTAEMHKLRVENCSTYSFEYGFKLMATGANAWINGNWFLNLSGEDDKYFIYMDNTGGAGISLNRFTFDYQSRANTDTAITIDGGENVFFGEVWDITAGETCLNLVASSIKNFVFLHSQYFDQTTDAGTNNLLYDLNHQGFIGSTHINFFQLTAGNPRIYIWGDVAGTEKNGYLSLMDDGVFRIANNTGEGMDLFSNGTMNINYDANGDINCFISCDTDENRYLKLYGRNAADTGRDFIGFRWGNGTQDRGEIITGNGDLFLDPTSHIVQVDDILKLTMRTGAPGTPADGMICYADGTTWDPGAGEGIYCYYAAAWHQMG